MEKQSRYPAQLRPVDVSITVSSHVTPNSTKITDYYRDLLEFVNDQTSTQYHLLAIALAHHRMAWIHPFDKEIKMFTYAILIKHKFPIRASC